MKFYNKKGNLTRIEHWEPFYAKDSLNTSYYMSDGPTITSIKKFRKGKLVKEILYTLWIDEASVLNYKFKRVVITK